MSILRRFARNERGNVAMLFGMLAVPVFSMIGAAVDYGRALDAKTRLQAIADAAAIAGARIPATTAEKRVAAAAAIFNANVAGTDLASVTPVITASNAEVAISAQAIVKTTISQLMGVEKIDIMASSGARAQVENGGVVCLLALNPSAEDGLHLQGINKISQQNCWAWVNSSHSNALNAVGTSTGVADGFCTVGGVNGSEHFAPSPYTACKEMPDPFAAKFASYAPPSKQCAGSDGKTQLQNGDHILEPGTYCKGLSLKPQANVFFKPGVYVIKDGEFEVQAQARAYGSGVTIYFTGSGASMHVKGGGEIDLTPPKTGDLAGFLIVQDRDANPGNEIEPQGGGRFKMEGVLYAPTWRVNISGNGKLNEEAKFWTMVADSFYMEGNGQLYLSSDFGTAGLPDLMPKIPTGPLLLR